MDRSWKNYGIKLLRRRKTYCWALILALRDCGEIFAFLFCRIPLRPHSVGWVDVPLEALQIDNYESYDIFSPFDFRIVFDFPTFWPLMKRRREQPVCCASILGSGNQKFQPVRPLEMARLSREPMLSHFNFIGDVASTRRELKGNVMKWSKHEKMKIVNLQNVPVERKRLIRQITENNIWISMFYFTGIKPQASAFHTHFGV